MSHLAVRDYYRMGWNGQTGMGNGLGLLATPSITQGSFTQTTKHPGLTFPGWLVSKGHLAINDQVSPTLIRSLYLQYVSAKAGVSPEAWLKSDGFKKAELPAFSDPTQLSIPIVGMAGRPLAKAPYLQFSGKEDLSTLSGLRVAWNFIVGVKWSKWVKSPEDKAAMAKAAEKAAVMSVLTGQAPSDILPTLATTPVTQTSPYVPPVYAPPVYAPPLSPPPVTQTPPVYYPPVTAEPAPYSPPAQDVINSYSEPAPAPSGGIFQGIIDWFTGASTEPAPAPVYTAPPSAAPQVAPAGPTAPSGTWSSMAVAPSVLAQLVPTPKPYTSPSNIAKTGIMTSSAGMTVAPPAAPGMNPMMKLGLGVAAVGAVMFFMRRKRS
jgi:hypothetical protein